MNSHLTIIHVTAVALVCGCVSKKDAQLQAQQAYQAGFDAGRAEAELSQTHVFVSGPVQRQQVLWHPDLTVAQAIVDAVYTAPNDPTSIVITRNGVAHPVDPQNLLRGIDFTLEPGDQIQLIP